MSKFNATLEREAATNYMGAKAFKQDPKTEFVSLLLTSFVEDSYYEKAGDTVKRLKGLLTSVKPLFAAKAAVYARKEFNMRSISHVVAGEIAAAAAGQPWAKGFYNAVVSRPDDMLEILSYFQSKGNTYPTNAMKKGFAKAFDKFDAYQLAKYRNEGKKISLIDIVNLCHPKGNEKNKQALNQLVEGTLKNTNTWEAKLSAAGKGQGQEAKKEAWESLILTKKIGYMALLRNLRNILNEGISNEAFAMAMNYLSNEKAVRNSKQFPFRFLSAYEEVSKIGESDSGLVFEKDGGSRKAEALATLEKAINASISNLPLLEGETVILTDNSGSMRGDGAGSSAISAMSSRKTADIANLFATMYWSRCDNTVVGLFGDTLRMPKLNRNTGLFDNYKTVNKEGGKVGGGTETGIFHMFEQLAREKRQVARIVIFSDMQIGTGCRWYDTGSRRGDDFNRLYQAYKKISPMTNVYSVDLKGHGTTMFKSGEYKIAGWSEKIFNIMELLEQDRSALVNQIEAVEF